MNDLDLLDRFGPRPPTSPSDAAMSAARQRLDDAMAEAPGPTRLPRRRLPLVAVAAAAAVAAVGVTTTPALVGSDGSVAVASVDPLTFPLTPTALPDALGDPVFEREADRFVAARYGPITNGLSIVTDVEDDGYWDIPDDSPTTDIDGHEARIVNRTVYGGTPQGAAAVSMIWEGDDGDWTAVTGSGDYADPARVEAFAESLQDKPQPVDLSLAVAPEGWTLATYQADRILVFVAPDGDARDGLTVALTPRASSDLSGYGAREVGNLTVNATPAAIGRQDSDHGGDPTWILVAQTTSGQTFSVQAPASLTRDQVIQIAEGVTYRP
ncbi:hypothetical protein [Nocardioides sp. 1609]|uniref:hypothetical protein n=1 Tax=Nocardioides sp. 1609 TaxID=2508327 RepID=UPI00106F6FD8|nr:hypothetical protein [Nocardioides sp. 1609]